jgi:hypothetical protein
MYRLIDDANVASQGRLLDVQESQGAAKHHSDVVEGPRIGFQRSCDANLLVHGSKAASLEAERAATREAARGAAYEVVRGVARETVRGTSRGAAGGAL